MQHLHLFGVQGQGVQDPHFRSPSRPTQILHSFDIFQVWLIMTTTIDSWSLSKWLFAVRSVTMTLSPLDREMMIHAPIHFNSFYYFTVYSSLFIGLLSIQLNCMHKLDRMEDLAQLQEHMQQRLINLRKLRSGKPICPQSTDIPHPDGDGKVERGTTLFI